MTIILRPGSTVVFTGDSITDCRRLESEDGLGSGYPLRIAGEWGLRYPDRPVTWLNTGGPGRSRRTHGGLAAPGRLTGPWAARPRQP